MSLRRRRPLRGPAPKEQAIDQVCVICKGRIVVNVLGRCVRTSCCGMLMHRACHRMMVERMPTCGQCSHPNGDRSVILETDEELHDDDEDEGMDGLRRQIDLYRQESRQLDTHYEGSFLWHVLPYGIDTSTWSVYYMLLLNFAALFSNCIIYVQFGGNSN